MDNFALSLSYDCNLSAEENYSSGMTGGGFSNK
jgi:hypothetical protein